MNDVCVNFTLAIFWLIDPPWQVVYRWTGIVSSLIVCLSQDNVLEIDSTLLSMVLRMIGYEYVLEIDDKIIANEM